MTQSILWLVQQQRNAGFEHQHVGERSFIAVLGVAFSSVSLRHRRDPSGAGPAGGVGQVRYSRALCRVYAVHSLSALLCKTIVKHRHKLHLFALQGTCAVLPKRSQWDTEEMRSRSKIWSLEMPVHREHRGGEVFPPARSPKMGPCVRGEAKPLDVARCRAWLATCLLGQASVPHTLTCLELKSFWCLKLF